MNPHFGQYVCVCVFSNVSFFTGSGSRRWSKSREGPEERSADIVSDREEEDL